jgi:hypothetical protein
MQCLKASIRFHDDSGFDGSAYEQGPRFLEFIAGDFLTSRANTIRIVCGLFEPYFGEDFKLS